MKNQKLFLQFGNFFDFLDFLKALTLVNFEWILNTEIDVISNKEMGLSCINNLQTNLSDYAIIESNS